jgi:hypothetical protein
VCQITSTYSTEAFGVVQNTYNTILSWKISPEIIVLSVCVFSLSTFEPVDRFTKLVWMLCQPSTFPTFGNNNMAEARTCKAGAILGPLNIGY